MKHSFEGYIKLKYQVVARAFCLSRWSVKMDDLEKETNLLTKSTSKKLPELICREETTPSLPELTCRQKSTKFTIKGLWYNLFFHKSCFMKQVWPEVLTWKFIFQPIPKYPNNIIYYPNSIFFSWYPHLYFGMFPNCFPFFALLLHKTMLSRI